MQDAAFFFSIVHVRFIQASHISSLFPFITEQAEEWLHSHLKDVHTPVPGTNKYFTLHGKATLKILRSQTVRWKDCPGLFGWAQSNHIESEKERTFPSCSKERDEMKGGGEIWSMRGIQPTTTGFENGGEEDHRSRNIVITFEIYEEAIIFHCGLCSNWINLHLNSCFKCFFSLCWEINTFNYS